MKAVGGFRNDLLDAIWELVWSGEVTNDTLAPLRSLRRDAPESCAVPAARRISFAADQPLAGVRRPLVVAGHTGGAMGQLHRTPGGHRDPTAPSLRRADSRTSRGREHPRRFCRTVSHPEGHGGGGQDPPRLFCGGFRGSPVRSSRRRGPLARARRSRAPKTRRRPPFSRRPTPPTPSARRSNGPRSPTNACALNEPPEHASLSRMASWSDSSAAPDNN